MEGKSPPAFPRKPAGNPESSIGVVSRQSSYANPIGALCSPILDWDRCIARGIRCPISDPYARSFPRARGNRGRIPRQVPGTLRAVCWLRRSATSRISWGKPSHNWVLSPILAARPPFAFRTPARPAGHSGRLGGPPRDLGRSSRTNAASLQSRSICCAISAPA